MQDTKITSGLQIVPQSLSDFGKVDSDAIADLVTAAKISLNEDCPAPPVFLSITDGIKEYPLFHLDALSLFIGKAKSRKTFAVLLFLAMVIAKKAVAKNILFRPVPGKTVVIVFDTEMAKWRVHRTAKRIQKLSGNFDEFDLEVYSLRGMTPEERIQAIVYVLKSRTDVILIAIDGIRDLLYDINDPKESTEVLTYLTKWCAEYNIHIIGILHQNKGDNNARGHIGTEGVNKADATITVSKDKDNQEISIIEASESRDQDFPPFAIGINDQGLPYVVDDWQPEGKIHATAKSNRTPFDFPLETHEMILAMTFKTNPEPKRGELVEALRLALQSFSIPSGDLKIRNFISYYVDNRKWVEKIGIDKSPLAYYKSTELCHSTVVVPQCI